MNISALRTGWRLSPRTRRGPADVLDHATSEIGVGTKLGIDATRKLPGEGFKAPGRR